MPVLILAVSALILMRIAIVEFEEIAEEMAHELLPVAKVQKHVLQAAMPPNDYVVHGDPSERDRFLLVSREVEEAFTTALAAPFGLPEEIAMVLSAYQKWGQATALGELIFINPSPVGDPSAAALMERMDRLVDEAVGFLDRVLELAHAEADESLDEARMLEQRALFTILLVSGASLALAIAAGGFLSRRVFAPISILEVGARRLGGGELSYRIPLNRRDELGQVARAFNDMAERLKQSQEALADTAIRDALTGCFNRREFHRRLQEELAVSRRYGRSLSLLMLDLDHFKVVNDTYGHQAGDEVLKAVAGTVRHALRVVDMVARFGGEEFTVILPETALAGGVDVAERIRSAIENVRVTLETGEAVQITVSIGVVAFPLSGAAPRSEESLIAEADQALYIAKNNGRNRVWASQSDNLA